MNTEKPSKRVKVCRCGQEFTVESRNQKSCPTCIEAKRAYEAMHPRPLRVCVKCGIESRECQYRQCPACQAAERLEYKRSRTPLGEHWSNRDHVMRAAKGGEGEYHDTLPMAINGMLLKLRKITRGTRIGALEVHLMTIARQEGVLTIERCNHLLDNVKFGTLEWDKEVDKVFLEFFGRELDRKNKAQIDADIATLLGMDKNPYLGDRGQAVMAAYNKRHAHREKHPLQASDPNWKPKEEPVHKSAAERSDDKEYDSRIGSLTDMFALIFYMRATPDRQEAMRKKWAKNGYHHLLEMVGYDAPEPEAVEPEQEPHADQDAIDAAFDDLMADLDI